MRLTYLHYFSFLTTVSSRYSLFEQTSLPSALDVTLVCISVIKIDTGTTISLDIRAWNVAIKGLIMASNFSIRGLFGTAYFTIRGLFVATYFAVRDLFITHSINKNFETKYNRGEMKNLRKYLRR